MVSDKQSEPVNQASPVDQEVHMAVPDVPCWCCGESDLESIPPTYTDIRTCICRACGFVQRRKKVITEEVPTEGFYYGTNFEVAMKNIEQRQLHVETRLRIYMEYIEKHIDLASINSFCDIGGAEGLLSYLMVRKHDHLKAYNVDPDPACIEYGQKNYQGVSHSIGTSEVPGITDPVDMLIDFGGIYRAMDPGKALGNYFDLLTPGGFLVIAVNVIPNLKLARTGEYPNSIALYDQPRGEVFQRSFFSLDLCREFLQTRFEIVDESMIVPFPFHHKELPFFVCRKKEVVDQLALHPESYKVNLDMVRGYARMITIDRLKQLKGTMGSRVGVIGISNEARIIASCCEEAGLEVKTTIVPSLLKHQDRNDVMDWRAFNRDDLDFCIVGDRTQSNELIDLIEFCQMQKLKPVVSSWGSVVDQYPLTLDWAGDVVLFQAASFSPIE